MKCFGYRAVLCVVLFFFFFFASLFPHLIRHITVDTYEEGIPVCAITVIKILMMDLFTCMGLFQFPSLWESYVCLEN